MFRVSCIQLKSNNSFNDNFAKTEKQRELRKSDLFLQNANDVHNLNRIAGSWWATELTRNGSDYSS